MLLIRNRLSVAANLGCELVKAISDQLKTIANWLHLSRLLPRRIFETYDRMLELERTQSELKNLAIHLDTSIDHLFEQMHELAAGQFEWRAQASPNLSQWVPHPAERYRPADPKPFAQILAQAEAEFPRVYPLWKERLDATKEAFVRTTVGNVAHARDCSVAL
jgi:hypothetical protein